MEHAPLIIDIEGTALSYLDRRRLANPLVGGIILFGRNWKDREQLTQLTTSIKRLRSDLLICVDHEGGRVQRFRTDGFTHLPPMRALGDLWMQDAMRAQDVATACGFVLATELLACGVDFSFTPVLDLDWGPSGVIGDRAFHADARVVTMLSKSLMHGLLRAGMGNCGKHFPGHGFVAADSHTDLPRDTRTLKSILSQDAAPYGWLGTTLDAVMAAHVVYPKVDSRPAGYSSRWLQEVLRGRLAFGGAIFTDDLSMEAARHIDGRTVTPFEAVLAALQAGCDQTLLCNQSLEGGRVLDETIGKLEEAQLESRWTPSSASENRRKALLNRLPPPEWDALVQSPQYLHALALVSETAKITK